MNKLLVIIFCSTLATSIVSCKKNQQEPEPSAFVIQSFIGSVQIESGGSVHQAVIGQPLEKDTVISTQTKSFVDILCGTDGVIRINEMTRLMVSQASLTEDSIKATLNLDKGNVFATFAKMKKDSSIEIKTPTAVAAVRGTSFRVSSDQDKSSIEVLSGKVQVNPVKDNVVIENVSSIIEENKSAEISAADVEEISQSKKEIAVTEIQPDVIEKIKSDAMGISVPVTASAEIKKELDSVNISHTEVNVKPLSAEEVEKQAPAEVPATIEETPKPEESTPVVKETKPAVKENKANEAALLKAQQEKEEQDRLAREAVLKAEEERLKAEEAKKAQEQKENRVKNIPNI